MATTRKGKSGFVYRPRPEDSIKKREQQSGSSREGYIKQDVKVWTPPTGPNKVRILPPTWDDAVHFGLDVWVHYQVGVDQNAYICLKKNPDIVDPQDCPCCEQRQKFQQDDNQEAADALNPRKRVLVYIIDRNRENDGVVLWPMPYTVDRDLAAASQDEETGELYFIDHPTKGYDVLFTRDGQGQTTKYRTPHLGKRPRPISDDAELMDEWLDWVTENPIPDMLIIPDAEAMEEALESNPTGRRIERDAKADKARGKGRRGARDEDEDDEEEPPRRRATGRARATEDEDEDEPPRRRAIRSRAQEEDEDDEAPPARRRRAGVEDEDEEEAALRGRKKARVVEEDNDDEEEAPRSRRSATTRAKSRAPADEDEDEAGEDEEAAPRAKSSRTSAKGKASRADPDDSEDDDEPPPRPTLGKRTAPGKSSGKLGGLRR